MLGVMSLRWLEMGDNKTGLGGRHVLFTKIVVAAPREFGRLAPILGNGRYSTGESCERRQSVTQNRVCAGAIEDIGMPTYIPMDAEHLNRARNRI